MKKLLEPEIVSRMLKAREDALTSKDPDQARKARNKLLYLIRRNKGIANAHGIEPVSCDEGSWFLVLSPNDPGYVGTKIK